MKTNKKKMFFPAVKKGTIDSYIIFPRCPLIFRLDFRRILTYLFLLQDKRMNCNEKSIYYERIRQIGIRKDKNLYLFKINPRVNQRIGDVADQF